MSKISVIHTINFVADVDLEGLETHQRQILEAMSDQERQAFFTLLTKTVLEENFIPTINENNTFASISLG